jgi:beta-galactosidase/beta-glucuronidase
MSKYSKAEELIHLKSKFFDQANLITPLNEYPRPYFKREQWTNLNGLWDFYLQKNAINGLLINQKLHLIKDFNQKILVPFSVESFASQIHENVLPNDLMWYRKEINISEINEEQNYFLNFEKVDQICQVFINSIQIYQHIGGYIHFSINITSALKIGKNEIVVIVQDLSNTSFLTFGKQTLNRGGIWYTPSSGIYGTVWLETVPKVHLKDVIVKTNITKSEVTFQIDKIGKLDYTIQIFADSLITTLENTNKYKFSKIKLWSYENPILYKAIITYGNDKVETYFSFKSNSLKKVNNQNYACINDQPFFINGLLDQGYYSSSSLTPLSVDEMLYDIQTIKELGFNTLRKHIKVESRLYYYECDRLGINLIQDFPSVFKTYNPLYMAIFPMLGINFNDKKVSKFNGLTEDMQEYFKFELKEIVAELKKHPSIFCYTLFNEGWGQFSTKDTFEYLKSLDNTRLIDATSGWYDRNIGDFFSQHRYILKYNYKKDPINNRIVFLSEFGGYTLGLKEHLTNSFIAGYNKFKNSEQLTLNYQKLFQKQIIPNIQKGLGGIIYTQLSDVEDEVNGLLTYDRKVLKINENVIKNINKQITEEFKKKIN